MEQLSQSSAAAAASPAPVAAEQQNEPLIHLQQQYQLAQEEIAVLQAQVGRLSSLVDCPNSSSAGEDESASSLQQQLEAALCELSHTQALLQQVTQSADAAVQSACEARSGALRLLLADTVRQLREAQQQVAEAQQLAADKAEDCEAMRSALAAANTHISQLTQPQHSSPPQHTLQESDAQQLCPQHTHTAASVQAQQCACGQDGGAPSSCCCCQQDVAQQQLAEQRQQLEDAHEQIRDLALLLALKHDCVEFAERRAAMLEHQLAAAQQKAAEASAAATAAAAAETQQRRRSCSSIAEEQDQRLDGSLGRNCPMQQQQHQQVADGHAQQQQQQQQPQQHSAGKAMGLAGSLSAALSNAANGLNSLKGPKGEADPNDHHLQPPPRQQVSPPPPPPPPLSPFAMARNFVAGREAEAIARLKDELRECEQEAAALAAANKSYETQLAGLQTLLVAKVSQSNRLDKEVKELGKSLRVTEAAAVADRSSLEQQLSQLSVRLVGMQKALAASQQREQQLEGQLVATRAKLAEVLDTLVSDAAALQQHEPAHYKLLASHMPALLADAVAASGSAHSMGDNNVAPGDDLNNLQAVRAASVPALLAASLSRGGSSTSWQLGTSTTTGGRPAGQRAGSGIAAAHSDLPPFTQAMRSFIGSRTSLSSHDGAATWGVAGSGGTASGAAGTCSSSKDGVAASLNSWGHRSIAASAGQVTGAASVPPGKQSAAAKLLDALRIGKKGGSISRDPDEFGGGGCDEDEAAAAVPPIVAQPGRTTGSGEYSYVLLES